MDDSDAEEPLNEAGGKIFSLMWLERQRGIGMVSYHTLSSAKFRFSCSLKAYKVGIARRLAHERNPDVYSSHEVYFMSTRASAIARIIGPCRGREFLREHIGNMILGNENVSSVSVF